MLGMTYHDRVAKTMGLFRNLQHGGILLRFSTFPSGIENRRFTQIENFFRRKTPQNATSHFQKETERS